MRPGIWLMLVLFVVAPLLGLASDSPNLEKSFFNAWRNSPAMAAGGLSAPVLLLIAFVSLPDAPQFPMSASRSPFVPPRA